MITVLAIAAILCYLGSTIAAYCFVISSTIGLIDSKKNKAKAGQIINLIFILLNVATIIRAVFFNG